MPISQIKVKVHRTGQEIRTADEAYLKIYKLTENIYLLSYFCYFILTRLSIRCEKKNGVLAVKVEEYRQGPIFNTLCDIYLLEKTVMSDVDEKSLGLEIIIEPSKLMEAPPTKVKSFLEAQAEWIKPVHALSDLHVGIISTQIGEPCGLAVYADELSEELSKLASIKILSIPVFGITERNKKHYQRLYNEIVELKLNLVHILQHAGTFQVYSDLAQFTNHLRSLGIKVVISATSPYLETVKADASHISQIADLTLLHTQQDLDFFKNKADGRMAVLPHGIKLFPDEPKNEARKRNMITSSAVIATHGMFAPSYKGVNDLISAIAILKKSYPDIHLLLICARDRYPIQETEAELQVQHLALTKNVTVYPHFLPTEEVYSLLHCADIVAFPYVGNFKDISGAFRKGLASRRPVIVSNAPCFDPEFPLIKVPQQNPQKLAEAIKDLYENPSKAEGYVESTATWIKEYSWEKVSRKLADLYMTLWS